MLPTLDEYLRDGESGPLSNSYVDHPEFSSLYLRKPSRRYIKIHGRMEKIEKVLEVANITAKKPRNGAFTRLIEKLDQEWDGPIFVESVLEPQFAAALVRMGFMPVNQDEDWGGFTHHFVKNLHKGQKDGGTAVPPGYL